MATRVYQGKRYNKNASALVADALTVEEALQINVNGEAFTVSMRTPGDDFFLTRGLLHVEGIIKDTNWMPEMKVVEKLDNGVVSVLDVAIPEKLLGEQFTNSRSLLSVSSCGICGKTSLEDIEVNESALDADLQVSVTEIQSMFKLMSQQQFDFQKSGGTHAAAAFSLDGELLCAMEDIGRHNAVDKVIGKLISEKRLHLAKVLTVSGRISYEIVIKCFKGKIPFLAAVSAPSSLAVDYAKELGLTLFGFCREDRITCYANAHRVRSETIKA